jgi:hypothetical protein
MALCGVCAISSPAWAQSVASGSLHGTVTDATAAALPGVTATLTSPALQVPQLVAVTDQNGNYRFTDLPAGTYRVAFELTGFATLVRDQLRITVGFVAAIDVTLALAGVEQTVTVSGNSPVVDTTTTSTGTTLTREVLESVPRGGGLEDVFVMTPGVTTQGAPDVGDSNLASRQNIQAFGVANIPTLKVEGINTTDSGGDSSGSYITSYAFAEVGLKTSGNDAEISTPGISMVAVLKSGGNDFHGAYQGSFERPGLQSNNITPELKAQGLSFTQPLSNYYDVAGDLGGRLIKDKLWFYGALNRQSQSIGLLGFTRQSGVPALFQTSLTSGALKFSYQLTRNNKVILMWAHNSKRQPENSASRFVPLESTRDYYNPIYMYKGELQTTLSDHMFLNVVAGNSGYFADYRSDYATPGNAPRLDLSTGRYSGSNPSLNQQGQGRYQLDDSLSYFPDHRFVGGQHELKIGTTAYLDLDGTGKLANPAGNYLLYDNGVTPTKIDMYNYPIQPSDRASTFAAYIKDTWRISKAVTVNLGVRWTRQHSSLPAQSVAASQEFPTLFPAATFPSRDLLTWTSTVPRVGVAWNLDGKTAVKATFGIYNYDIGDGFADAYNQNAVETATFRWTDPTHANDYVPGTINLSLNGPDFIGISAAANNILNSHLRQPMTDETTVSFERELRENLGFQVLYVYQNQRDNFDLSGWNVLRPYTAWDIPITVSEPGSNGAVGPNSPSITFYTYEPAYKGAAFVGQERLNTSNNSWYHTMEFTVTKRAAQRWAMIASIWAIKNHRWITNTFDNPNANFFPLDETWTYAATVSGSYRLPVDVQVSGFLQSKTGVLGQRTYTFTGVPQLSTLTLPLESFGSEKGKALNVLDLRIAKGFSLGGTRRFEVRFDVFNTLNSSAPTAVSFISGPTFAYATSVLFPRVARLGARLSF